MNETQIKLVESEGFTINIPSLVGPPMTIRTKSDEVVILVSLRLRPRDNVMNVAFDISASGDSASVSSLDENSSSDFSRYWRASLLGA